MHGPDEAEAHCRRPMDAPWAGIHATGQCEASLRRYQPDQVPRDCLNRGDMAAVPPLRAALEHEAATWVENAADAWPCPFRRGGPGPLTES